MISAMIVVLDEFADLGFEIPGQEIVFEQDPVLQGLMPALDFSLGHGVIGRAPNVLDAFVAEPSGKIGGDIA